MYKGENIVLQCCFNREDKLNYIEKMIKEEINVFLLKFRSAWIEEQLPLDRLFLDIKPNTLHFWDKDPFQERQVFVAGTDKEIDIQTKLSHICLIELSGRSHLDCEEVFKLYVKIFLVFQHVLISYGKEYYTNFLRKLLDRIKGLKYEWLMEFNQLEIKALQDYQQDESSYFSLFTSMMSMTNSKDDKSVDVIDTAKWISIINEAVLDNNYRSRLPSYEFLINLFIIISQKISQQMDILITSLVMIREFHMKNF
jgi:hypothetical protein